MLNKLMPSVAVVVLVVVSACLPSGGSTSTVSTKISPGDDPNFTIVTHSDSGFGSFNRKVDVFGVPIYAVVAVEDQRLLHAANLLAQYLDNDENGVVDNQKVLDAMHTAKAFMVIWNNEADLADITPPNDAVGQDLGNDETIPVWHTNGHMGRFDAALEEVLHIVTHAGYANAYPDLFGEHVGSTLANAMDIARGGRFIRIPNPYPADAWYTYDDRTCEYDCMVTEYFYWSLSSILGAQANRSAEINAEWRLHTSQLVRQGDPAVYALLTNPEYKLPTVLPDGTYQGT